MKTAVGGLWPNQENPEEQKRREGSRAGRGSLFGSPRPQPSTAWRQDPTRSHRLHLAPTRAQRGLSPTLPPARERGSREALEGLSPEAPSCAPPGGGGPELLPALSSAGRRREAARAPRSWRRCLSPRVRASAPQPARTRGPAHRPRPFHTGASLQSLQRFPLPQMHRQQHKANRVTEN